MLRTLLICVCLIGLVVGVYGRSVSFGFVDFDDPEYVRDNWRVNQGLTAEGVTWAFETNYIANWHPLTWISFMAEVQAWGPSARMMHAVNIALHAANVLLLFGVLYWSTGARWRSALVAGLFAVHPMHVESVAWISERKDVLSTLFWLLAMWAYVWWARRGGAWRYVLAALCLALGLMCKAMLVTLPCVLLLLDWWPLRRVKIGSVLKGDPPAEPGANGSARSIGALFIEKIPLLAIVGLVAYMTCRAQRGGGQLQEGDWLPMGQCVANAVVSYVRYLGKMFWPVDLAALYPHPGLIGREWPDGIVAASAALLMVITATAVVFARRTPWFIVGWLWFVGTMLPVSGVVQIGRQAMADRYAYVPFIGLYIIMAWGLGAMVARASAMRAPIAIASCAWVMMLAFIAWQQVGVWTDSRTLFTHAIAVTDDNWMMHNNLGGMLVQDGRAEDGLREVDVALAIAPHAAWVHNHRGTILAGMNRLFEAQEAFEQANAIDETYAESRLNLGIVLAKRERLPEALAAFGNALTIDPNYALAHANMGVVLGQMRRSGEAAEHLQRAIDIDPSLSERYSEALVNLRSQSAAGGASP
jgi:Tfp pilus assembly protein PilF